MTRIFSYLKDSKRAVVLIIMLLVVQAFCDLGLPQYTSQIVDIGIQQGGIENVAPNEIRQTTLDQLCLFLSEDEEQTVKRAYTQKEDDQSVLILNTSDKKEIAQLNELLGAPMVMVSTMQQGEGVQQAPGIPAQEDNKSSEEMSSGALTKEQLIVMKEKMLAQMGKLSDSIIEQKALLFVKQEYQALGINLGRLQTSYLIKTGSKMLGLALVMMAVSIVTGYLAARTAAKVGRDLRGSVFKKVISFSNNEMDQFSTASLITRSTNDIQQIQQVCVILLRLVAYAPILGIGGIIKVANTRTGMGWIIFVGVAAIMVVVGTLMVVAMPKFKMMQVLVDKLNLVSREILTGIPVIRAFSREKFEEERFDKANKELMGTQLFTNRVMTFMLPLMMFLMNGLSVLIVWAGAKGIDAGSLQVGDMMAFITYTMQIVMSFLMLSMVSIVLPRAGVAAARIDEVLNTQSSIKDSEHVKDSEIKEEKGIVTFEDVCFRYPAADEDALEHISFTARPGQTTAIIGSTGCGKTTLIHLIPRFYDVTSGRILIDGVDIRELSQEKLHSYLGLVPQKSVLFSGNIQSNIKFGKDHISDEKMKEAAEIAQAVEFIESKPEAYESEIAQGGTNVSGGQKQRLSIARAIAKSPKVFLFDDSFSALDYKTDVTLRKALNERISDATMIIVAQRISTIMHADQIIVLDEGKIVGIGTHKELLEGCQAYREIASSQLSEKELKGGAQVESA